MAQEDMQKTPSYSLQAPQPASGTVGSVPVYGGDVSPESSGLDQPLRQDVIKVGRTQYAVGLYWQPLQDVDDPIPEIREAMESEKDTDLYAKYNGRVPQYALGKTSKGHRPGLTVAGIAVLDSLADKSSFVAVFKVEEGWWFLVARNDLILPEDDVLYTSEQEAKDAFFSMMSVPDWGYKIAPKSWQIDDAEEMDVASLLKEGHQVKLLSLGTMRGIRALTIIALAVLLFAGLIVYLVWTLYQKAEQKAVSIQPELPVPEIIQEEPVRIEEKPWEKLISVSDFLSKCWSSSYQLKSMIIPGWRIGSITCTPTEITTNWTREYGHIGWLESAIKKQYKLAGEVSVNPEATGASFKLAIKDLPTHTSIPTLSLPKLKREMHTLSQAMSFPISLSEGEITIEVANNAIKNKDVSTEDNQEQTIKQVYRFLVFAFTSSMDPPAWEAFFAKFNGLEITKIEYNPNAESSLTNNWKYEGRIYENNNYIQK